MIQLPSLRVFIGLLVDQFTASTRIMVNEHQHSET